MLTLAILQIGGIERPVRDEEAARCGKSWDSSIRGPDGVRSSSQLREVEGGEAGCD